MSAERMDQSVMGEELSRALDMFVELTGVSPDQSKFTLSMGGGMSDMDVSNMYKAISEALELDPTNVTAFFLLDAYSSAYIAEQNFSVEVMLKDPDRVALYLSKVTEFQAILKSDAVSKIGDDFKASLLVGLSHYDFLSEKVERYIEDNPFFLAFLRRDALRSISNLRVDQFLRGERDVKELKPSYLGEVHQFWDINNLLGMLCKQKSGVSLNLVRDPTEMQSYFAFAVRNGGNIFTLSDVPIGNHPLSNQMTRRPDRRFDERAAKNWFPYGLLDVKTTEDGRSAYVDMARKTRLSPLQKDYLPLRRIADLDAPEVIWIAMMFDLIIDKFWDKKHEQKELSYTGQMIADESGFEAVAKKANLPITTSHALNLPKLTKADVTRDALELSDVGSFGGSPNNWLEDRYVSKIPEEAFNLLSSAEYTHYIPSALKTKRGKNHANALTCQSGQVSVLNVDDEKLHFWDREERSYLQALSTSYIGTPARLQADRKWLARYNMASHVNRLANLEYEQTKNEILDWWEDALGKNIDHLSRLSVNEEFWVSVKEESSDGCTKFSGSLGEGGDKYRLMYRTENVNEAYKYARVFLIGDGLRRCYLNGAKASYLVTFRPQTAKHLAFMAGCSVDELPEVLRHWTHSSRSQGNAILDRIDPMAWKAKNPWSGDMFSTGIFLSKSSMNKLKKLHPEVDTTPNGGFSSVMTITM